MLDCLLFKQTDRHMKRIKLSLLLLSLTSCIGAPPDKPVKWESDYHNLEVEYGTPWGRIKPSIDTKNKTLFVLIDKRNGSSYIVKIANDVSFNELSNEAYYQAFSDEMLAENEKNRLLEEKTLTSMERYFINKFS